MAAKRLLHDAPAVLRTSGTHPDMVLIEACIDYGNLHLQIEGLSKGPRRIENEVQRSRRYAGLTRAIRPLLQRAADLRATMPEGHAARAAAFLAWDEGELVQRASRHGILEDRLLAAILLDLMES